MFDTTPSIMDSMNSSGFCREPATTTGTKDGGTEVKDQKGYSTHIITDRSVDFIKRNKDNPFFLYVSHAAVHNPYQTPEDTPENRPKVKKRGRQHARPKYKVMLEE